MLVPLLNPYLPGRGTEEKTSLPGPAISTLPKFEKEEGARFGSREATDIMEGELAGCPVGPASLPAAAIIKRPLVKAAFPAFVYAGTGPPGPPKDIEIT